MGRSKRNDGHSGHHHVVNRGVDFRTVFHSELDRSDFGRLIGEGHDRTGVSVVAYCLMTNHFHLVVDCPEGGLSTFMHHVTGNFAKRSNRRNDSDGPVFRGRFASRHIVTDQYLLNAVRYVHRNPLDIDRAMPLESYRWSSHRTMLGLRTPPHWLKPASVLEFFHTSQDFHEFVCGTDSTERAIVEAADLLDAVELVIEETRHILQGTSHGIARTAMIRALDRVDGATFDSIAGYLDYADSVGLERARQRAARLAAEDDSIDALLDRAWPLITPVDAPAATRHRRAG
jgi:REP element-mobilizing transposase RayT